MGMKVCKIWRASRSVMGVDMQMRMHNQSCELADGVCMSG
jgi:hypothetical protein